MPQQCFVLACLAWVGRVVFPGLTGGVGGSAASRRAPPVLPRFAAACSLDPGAWAAAWEMHVGTVSYADRVSLLASSFPSVYRNTMGWIQNGATSSSGW